MAMQPDVVLVILDVKMPRRDGFWVYDKVRAQSKVPIVFNTAYQDQRTVEEVKQRVGDKNCVVKGTNVQEFLERVDEIVAEVKKKAGQG